MTSVNINGILGPIPPGSIPDTNFLQTLQGQLDKQSFYVSNVGCHFMYDASNTDTPDGFNILAPANGVPGNWVRLQPALNSFAQLGVTGANLASGGASGAMVQWNTHNQVLGSFGHTTIGTASANVTISRAGNYNVNYNMNFTGLPSGVVVQVQQFLNAADQSGNGGTGALGFGSGTPIAQSVAYYQQGQAPAGFINAGSIDKTYTVAVPSGVRMQTFVNYIQAGGGSGIAISPTGTFFEIKDAGK